MLALLKTVLSTERRWCKEQILFCGAGLSQIENAFSLIEICGSLKDATICRSSTTNLATVHIVKIEFFRASFCSRLSTYFLHCFSFSHDVACARTLL